MNPTNLITPDTIGAAFGILGTILLATNGKRAGWGFVAYLISNAAWLSHAIGSNQTPLLVQTLIFTGSSLVGVWVWLINPRRKATP